MKLIFAQGNPGKEYVFTRHNVGFLIIDDLAKLHHTEFIKKSKFHAEIAETTINSEKVLFVKPTTFYNETGHAARLLTDFYKLDPATDFLVIYDELALPFGTIRTRLKGSDAGNNGIKSLNTHLGYTYARIRIGTYTEHRDRIPDKEFVLSSLTPQEKNALMDIAKHVDYFITQFIQDKFEPTKLTI